MFNAIGRFIVGFAKFFAGITLSCMVFAEIAIRLNEWHWNLKKRWYLRYVKDKEEFHLEGIELYYKEYGKQCPICKCWIPLDNFACPVCGKEERLEIA